MICPSKHRVLWVLWVPLWTGLWSTAAAARGAPVRAEATRETHVSAGTVLDLVHTRFHERWVPKPGVRVELETPFHVGDLRVGVIAFKNSRRRESVPGFRSVFVYTGWAWTWHVPRHVAVSLGGHVGNFFMDFGGAPFGDIEQTESEFAVTVDGRLRLPLTDAWSLGLGGAYRRVFTARRIEYGVASIHMVRTFETPTWLREFLR